MANDKVQIDLEIVTKAFNDALKNASVQTKSFEQAASSNFGSVANSFSVMAGNLAAQGVSKIISIVSDSFGRMLDEAKDAEEAANSLATALKLAGDTSQSTIDQLTSYAESLSKITTQDDDLIVKNQALITSLTNLNANGINQAVLSAANLAAVLGVDLNQATDIVIKAINGKATPEIKALGITVSNTKTDTQNLASIVKVLGDTNTTAADKTNTYTGAMLQNQNALGNLLGAFGSMVTQSNLVINSIKSMTSAITSATSIINTFYGIAVNSAPTESVKTLTTQINYLEGAIASAKTQLENYNTVEKFMLGKETQARITENTKLLNEAKEKLRLLTEEQNKSAQTSALNKRANSELTESQKAQIEASKQYTEQLAKENDDVSKSYAAKLDSLSVYYADKEALDTQTDATNYGMKLQRENEFFAARQTLLDAQYQDELNRVNQSTASEENKQKARLQLNNQYNSAVQKANLDHHKKTQDLQKQQQDFEQKQQEFKLQSTASLFGSMANLLAGSSKANFNTVKNFMLAEATISGYLAVQKALASGPPPWNFVAAAAVGVQTLANVNKINSMKAPAFKDGGIVPGASFNGDRVMARVNSGEMILNKQQQANLFNIANSGSNQDTSEVVYLLREIAYAVKSGTSIKINDREIINVVRDGLNSGRSFA